MSKDREALERAVAIAQSDPMTADQMEVRREDGQSWEEIAESAAYHCQRRSLKLSPFQEPPCVVDEDDPKERDKAAQRLLRKMLDAGVSRYEPDPLSALAEKENPRRVRAGA